MREQLTIASTTIKYKGIPVKLENDRIFILSFGTSVRRTKPHWLWVEIKKGNLSSEFVNLLKEKGLI